MTRSSFAWYHNMLSLKPVQLHSFLSMEGRPSPFRGIKQLGAGTDSFDSQFLRVKTCDLWLDLPHLSGISGSFELKRNSCAWDLGIMELKYTPWHGNCNFFKTTQVVAVCNKICLMCLVYWDSLLPSSSLSSVPFSPPPALSFLRILYWSLSWSWICFWSI